MLKNRLQFVDDRLFARAMAVGATHGKLIPAHQMLQKLTILDFVLPLLERAPGKDILEIGCGLGIHSALLSHHGRVSSTELSVPGSFVGADRGVEKIRESIFAELGNGEISFDYHDGRRLPYADGSFDVVFHNSVIEHVPDIAAFNTEVLRVLKPGGICICITGTPALCRFRLLRHYFLRMPLLLLIVAAKETIPRPWLRTVIPRLMGIARVPSQLRHKIIDRLTRVDQRLDALSDNASAAPSASRHSVEIRQLYSRLYHYIYFPTYNQVVLSKAANDLGLAPEELLLQVREHFRKARHRVRFDLAPATHGQHYRDAQHEMSEWRVERWTQYFSTTGYDVEQVAGYRYHHVFEITPSDSLNAKLYFRLAKTVHGWIRRNAHDPARASEIILLTRRPA